MLRRWIKIIRRCNIAFNKGVTPVLVNDNPLCVPSSRCLRDQKDSTHHQSYKALLALGQHVHTGHKQRILHTDSMWTQHRPEPKINTIINRINRWSYSFEEMYIALVYIYVPRPDCSRSAFCRWCTRKKLQY